MRKRRNLASENAGGGDGGTARRSLLCRLGWSYRDAAGVTVAVVATGAILVNTLFLQSGPHPAPIFGSKSAASAANETKDAAVGALPRSRESGPVKGDFAGPKKAEPSKSDPPAKTEPPGASRVASDVISDIQRELTRRGFYDGTIDGLPGPRTTSAIRDFEQAAGLKPGAEPNAALLRAIRSANAKVAKATTAGTSPASTGTHSASAAIPPFPGAHQIFSTRGLCFSFHTSACSRPPPPSTRIFIRISSSTTLSNDRRPPRTCQPNDSMVSSGPDSLAGSREGYVELQMPEGAPRLFII